MPDAPSPTPQELPEEIATAIESLIGEAKYEGGRFSASDGEDIARARSALTAAILSRLGEAEARREEATRVCAQRASVIQILGHHPDMTIAEAYDAAERSRDLSDALARVERLENALAGAVNRLNTKKSAASDWLYVVSEAGDLEVEMPAGFVAEPPPALTEAPSQGDQ